MNGEVAPLADLRAVTPERGGSPLLRTFPRADAASAMRQEAALVALRFPTIARPSAIPRMVPLGGIGFLTGRGDLIPVDDKKERSVRDTGGLGHGPRGFQQSGAS